MRPGQEAPSGEICMSWNNGGCSEGKAPERPDARVLELRCPTPRAELRRSGPREQGKGKGRQGSAWQGGKERVARREEN
eukprot:3213890-Alexandrium_andersonii.AAC.1